MIAGAENRDLLMDAITLGLTELVFTYGLDGNFMSTELVESTIYYTESTTKRKVSKILNIECKQLTLPFFVLNDIERQE
jgi:hypothetical protein